jgi:hypothetical protein
MLPTTVVAIVAGALVALAVLSVAAFAVGKLSKKNAAVLVGVLLALATLVGGLPPVIQAFQPGSVPVGPPATTRPAEPAAPNGTASSPAAGLAGSGR